MVLGMTKPIFSIICPCYNQGHFLTCAIQSVTDQLFIDWELIIIDDGSGDETRKIALSFIEQDSRIHYLYQENKGLSAARNFGVHKSFGDYLVFLDADDWLYVDFLDKVEREFVNGFDLVVTGYAHCKDESIIHHVTRSRHKLSIKEFTYGNYAPPVAFSLRKSILTEIGIFDESLKSAEDWDLWIRAAKCEVEMINIPDILAAYRYSDQSMSRDGERMYQALKAVFLKIPLNDPRINTLDQILPQDIDNAKGILALLMPCLGVLVMQGKIIEAVKLYFNEKEEFDLDPSETDFLILNSYLTFRYWNTKKELDRVFKEYEPLVIEFLEAVIQNKSEIQGIKKNLFFLSRKKMNHLKYGKVLGGIFNRILA